MWTNDAQSQALAREIAKNVVVAKLAPEEVSFFEDLIVEKKVESADRELAFGASDLAVLITPFAMAAVGKAFQFISEDFLKTFGKELGTLTINKIKDYWSAKDQNTISLTVEQLKETIYKTVAAEGLDEEKARAMANTVVDSLAPKT